MKTFLLGIFLAAICIATAAFGALPVAYPCSGCTEAQFDAAAQTRAQASGSFHGNIRLYDFAQNKLHKYEFQRDPREGGGYIWTTWRITPTADETDFFSKTVNAWIDTNHAMQTTVGIGASGGPSGSPPFPQSVANFIVSGSNPNGFYGLANTPQYQNTLSSYATAWLANYAHVQNANPATVSTWDLLIAVAQMQFSNSPPPTLTVVMDIVGGGKMTLTLKFEGDVSAPAHWNFTKLVDKNDIEVPLTKDDVAPNDGSTRNYDFTQSPNDWKPFSHYVEYGVSVPVTYNPNTHIVACAKAPDGTKRCVVAPH